MKHFFSHHLLRTAVLLLGILGILGVVAAGRYVPMQSGNQNPDAFLDVSANPQAKQGWLALGQAANPLATLDVQGVTIADSLHIFGNGWSTAKMRIGGTGIPASSDPKLVVDQGRIRASSLAGAGERPVCSDSTGLFKICNQAALPVCGNATTQTLTTAPTTNLCSVGTPSTVTGTGPWTWTCGNGTASQNVTCTTSSVNPTTTQDGVCSYDAAGTFLEACNPGTLTTTTSVAPLPNNPLPGALAATKVDYTCNGVQGGSNTFCTSNFTCPTDYHLSGCFLAGTPITTQEGITQPIESLVKNQQVLTHEGPSTLSDTMSFTYEGWVYGINGSKPFVTDSHPFMTTEGWKSFNPEKTKHTNPDLTVTLLHQGDILIKEHNRQEPLTQISRVWMKTQVYNLTVAGSHTYYADGYQVHNKTTNPYCKPTPAGIVPECGTQPSTCISGNSSSAQYTSQPVYGGSSGNQGSGRLCSDGTPMLNITAQWTCQGSSTTISCSSNFTNCPE